VETHCHRALVCIVFDTIYKQRDQLRLLSWTQYLPKFVEIAKCVHDIALSDSFGIELRQEFVQF